MNKCTIDLRDITLFTRNRYKFRQSSGYIRDSSGRYLHHLIMGKPEGNMVVDHINRNKLDNRRSNLRIVSKAENARNSDAYEKTTGVHLTSDHKSRRKPWKAMVKRNGKTTTTYHLTKLDALEARKRLVVAIQQE